MSQKRNKESVKRASMIRTLCFHWVRDNKPRLLFKFRRKVDNVVKPRRTYASRPGNNVGM